MNHDNISVSAKSESRRQSVAVESQGFCDTGGCCTLFGACIGTAPNLFAGCRNPLLRLFNNTNGRYYRP